MTNKKILIGAFFVFGILLINFILAQSSFSNPQLTNPGISSNFLRSQGISSFDFSQESCQKGQDFLIQIAPFGCEPSVVRSDLLEEQNVPVFCQLSATQFNPLIDVQAIDSISFKGDYPPEVSGIGFYPANAAFKNSRSTLLNSPVLENIGYAVIVLKQQPIESEMPDFVEGQLTATLRYDIENAFGIGKATYYLPELTEEQWNNKLRQYSFWNGKGYLRVDDVDTEGAVVSVYLDKDNRFSTVRLEKRQTSNNIFLPGLYCSAGLKLRLDGLENPDTRAKLNINGEIVEIGEGEKFLQNECTVRNIEKQGINQIVDISCNADDGFERFDLRIAPKVSLSVNGVEESYVVGDKLYEFKDITGNSKSVYVGYIGEASDGDKFIIPVVSPEFTSEAFRETLIYSQLPNLVKAAQFETGSTLVNLVTGVFTYGGLSIATAVDFLVTGNYPVGWIYEENSNKNSEGVEVLSNFGIPFIDDILGNKIEFKGLSGAEDKKIEGEVKDDYEKSMADYRKIIDSFPNEKESSDGATFGEKALIQVINLAYSVQQGEQTLEFCREFEERYPNSEISLPDFCSNELKISNSEISEFGVVINGKTKVVSFEGIYEPTSEEYSAVVLIRNPDGETERKVLRKNQVVYFGDREEEIYIVTQDIGKYKFKFYNGNWQWARYSINSWRNTVTELTSSDIPYVDIRNLAKELSNKDFAEGEKTLLGANAQKETISSTQFIQLISLDEDSARVKNSFFSDERKMIEDRAENFGSNYIFTLTNINLKKVAKVSVLPNIQNAGTEANFSFKIGIEKRAIQLSPEKINEKIEILNKSIEKWEDTSETLGTAVKGFNAACLATGTFLTAKNFFENTDGKSIARKDVMTSDGGWRDICASEIAKTGASMDSCLLDHNGDIERDVNAVHSAIQSQQAITEENVETKLNSIKDSLGDLDADLSEALTKQGYDEGKVSLTQARDIERLSLILNSNPSSELKELSEKKLDSILSDIKANSMSYAAYNKFLEEVKNQNWISGATNVDFQSSDKDAAVGNYGGATTNSMKENIPEGALIQPISFDNTKYYITLNNEGGNLYSIKNVYDGTGVLLQDGVKTDLIKSRYGKGFRKYDKTSYQNKFINPQVRYFESSPYKGRPAIVPFDTNNGWYAAGKQTLSGLGNIQAYDASGRVSSFWVCNVGENGKAEFNQGNLGIGDDICQQYNPGVGQIYGTFPGFEEGQTNTLTSKAVRAMDDASSQYKIGITGRIKILNELIPVGPPAVDVPDVQCQDLMSPEDCLLLFNACDPVVCPSSRCNLGGTYHVSDVVQSGIVGSIALCLPNIKEDIVVPICLSGVKAGIDSWVSVQKNYRQCLQTNLDTGETVGICDEINSIYLCDFFWSQAAPLSQAIIPKIFDIISGNDNPRGGGEYLGLNSAWGNAQDSVDYITQYYAGNSFNAFNIQSTAAIGSALCRNFISTTYPDGVGIDALIEPKSPPQFTAWFSEETFTTATVPPTSQYKVFYHIYAGENNLQNVGAYYNVFLRSPAGTSFYQTNPTLAVASGYIAKGDFASETKDFTAPEGYKEVCIRVNAQEECGFGKVSTDFAINYAQELYVQEQASQTDIDSESTCVSGTPSLYSLINPNIQAGVSDVVDPSLYDQGIIRICSSDIPGKGTEPGRWQPVGTCDGTRGDIKCYIDTKSVTSVIESTTIEDETLQEVEDNIVAGLLREGEYFDDAEFEKELKHIGELDARGKIARITDGLIGRAFFNVQKANLLLIRGDAYAGLVKGLADKIVKEKLSKSVESTDDAGLEQERWTIETALEEAEKRTGKYSDNEFFINSIYLDGILTDEQYEDIKGEGILNFEKEMDYVRGILVEKARKIVEGDDRKDITYDFKTRSEIEVIKVINVAQTTTFVDRTCDCGNDCSSYAKFIFEGAENNQGSDPLLLLSIMMQESDCRKDASSESSVGLMQINTINCGKYGLSSDAEACKKELLNNPKTNIEVGAKILRDKYNVNSGGRVFQGCSERNVKYYGWEAALRGYVGWGCAKGHDNYVEEVMGRFNELNSVSIDQIDGGIFTGA